MGPESGAPARPLDAFDAVILRELGIEAFAAWSHRPRGLRATDVASALGRDVRRVQDRITRMETDGVIAGYITVPNPNHMGTTLSTAYIPTHGAIDLARLDEAPGFVAAVAYLSSGLCYTFQHRNRAEREARLRAAAECAGSKGPALIMYEQAPPAVSQELSPLDWRILAAVAGDAKRSAHEVAHALGVTPKTVRKRLARMRAEGSMDEIAILDFSRLQGIFPFEIAVWCPDPKRAVLDLQQRLQNNFWLHFTGPEGGYSDLLLRVFASSAAEAQQLVGIVERTPGVTRGQALMAAAMHNNRAWLVDALEGQLERPAR